MLLLVLGTHPTPVLTGWYISAAAAELSRSTQLLTLTQTNCNSESEGRAVKLLLSFDSTVIPGFSLLEIHDQDILS
jgi:hypothetical protein